MRWCCCEDGSGNGFVYFAVAPGRLQLVLGLDMQCDWWRANSHVRCDAGRVAVMRGPLVYCAEQADNAGDLWTYRLADGVDVADATVTFESDLLGGVDAVTLPPFVRLRMPWTPVVHVRSA